MTCWEVMIAGAVGSARGGALLQPCCAPRARIVSSATAEPKPPSRRQCLRRVIALPAPRMTAADALRRAPTPPPRAVLRDGVDRVLTARRIVPALAAEQAAERDPVEHHQEDEHAHPQRSSA